MAAEEQRVTAIMFYKPRFVKRVYMVFFFLRYDGVNLQQKTKNGRRLDI